MGVTLTQCQCTVVTAEQDTASGHRRLTEQLSPLNHHPRESLVCLQPTSAGSFLAWGWEDHLLALLDTALHSRDPRDAFPGTSLLVAHVVPIIQHEQEDPA